jgi:hypothetical protein
LTAQGLSPCKIHSLVGCSHFYLLTTFPDWPPHDHIPFLYPNVGIVTPSHL